MNRIHPTAATGFGAASDQYVRGRPDYPPEVDGWLRDQLHVGAGKVVLDLGAGTGKFTPRLLATGASVIAVEPVAEMRGRLAATLPEVVALEGTAESIPLLDASVDAVVCAQAFHWFANRDALAEIRRVLKPGGWVGLIWNVRDDRVPWIARFTEILNRAEGETPRFHSGEWRTLFPHPGFAPWVEAEFTHQQVGSPEDVIVSRFRSTSFIAALPAIERERLEVEVRALIESELAGKSEVTLPHRTFAFALQKVE